MIAAECKCGFRIADEAGHVVEQTQRHLLEAHERRVSAATILSRTMPVDVSKVAVKRSQQGIGPATTSSPPSAVKPPANRSDTAALVQHLEQVLAAAQQRPPGASLLGARQPGVGQATASATTPATTNPDEERRKNQAFQERMIALRGLGQAITSSTQGRIIHS